MASGFLYNLLLIYDVLLIYLRVSKKHITILFIDFQWEIFVGAFIYAVISISSHTAREVIGVDLLPVQHMLLHRLMYRCFRGMQLVCWWKRQNLSLVRTCCCRRRYVKWENCGYPLSHKCAFHSTLAESFHTTTAASNDHYNLWIIFI